MILLWCYVGWRRVAATDRENQLVKRQQISVWFIPKIYIYNIHTYIHSQIPTNIYILKLYKHIKMMFQYTVYIYIYKYIHIYFVYMCIYVYIYAVYTYYILHQHGYIYIYIYILCAHIYIYIYVHKHIYIYIYMCIDCIFKINDELQYIHICIYLYTL